MHHEHHQKLEILGRRPTPFSQFVKDYVQTFRQLSGFGTQENLFGSDSALVDRFHLYPRRRLRFQPHLWSGHDGQCWTTWPLSDDAGAEAFIKSGLRAAPAPTCQDHSPHLAPCRQKNLRYHMVKLRGARTNAGLRLLRNYLDPIQLLFTESWRYCLRQDTQNLRAQVNNHHLGLLITCCMLWD